MPIEYCEDQAAFAGRCDPEEADALLEWLRSTPVPKADLGDCTDLHTALAQLLLVAKVTVTVPISDRILASCLDAAAGPQGAAARDEMIVR